LSTAAISFALIAEVRRRSRLAFLGLGSVLYLIALSASGVMPFEVPRFFLWYPVPVIPVAFLLAARGAQLAGESLWRSGRVTMTVAVLAFAPSVFAAGSFLRMVEEDLPGIRAHFNYRERGYEQAARAIRDDAGPRVADVLVGEVGAVGYHLMQHRVHDSAGISSPQILQFRHDDRDSLAAHGVTGEALDYGSARWVLRFLREERPEYVTTIRRFLYLPELEAMPAFQALYEPIGGPEAWTGEGMFQHTVYARRDRFRDEGDVQ
jgi:hypothetical protein